MPIVNNAAMERLPSKRADASNTETNATTLKKEKARLPTDDAQLLISNGRLFTQRGFSGAHPQRKKVGEFELKLSPMCTLASDHTSIKK